MKLLTLTLPVEKPEPLRMAPRTIDLRMPADVVLGWRVLVRGPAVILIAPEDSPAGGGYEIARSVCTLRWDSSNPADYDKMANFTSEPLARKTPEDPKAVA